MCFIPMDPNRVGIRGSQPSTSGVVDRIIWFSQRPRNNKIVWNSSRGVVNGWLVHETHISVAMPFSFAQVIVERCIEVRDCLYMGMLIDYGWRKADRIPRHN